MRWPWSGPDGSICGQNDVVSGSKRSCLGTVHGASSASYCGLMLPHYYVFSMQVGVLMLDCGIPKHGSAHGGLVALQCAQQCVLWCAALLVGAAKCAAGLVAWLVREK